MRNWMTKEESYKKFKHEQFTKAIETSKPFLDEVWKKFQFLMNENPDSTDPRDMNFEIWHKDFSNKGMEILMNQRLKEENIGLKCQVSSNPSATRALSARFIFQRGDEK